MKSVAEIAEEFMSRGGKRLRPRLCRAVYDRAVGAAGAVPSGDIEAVCEAVERFHKASLIHDDIQDGDEMRYGVMSIWKEYGVAVAIAVGDWLVASGYSLIAGSGFGNVAVMLAAVARSHQRLCEGQGAELTGTASMLEIFEKKTAEAFALAAELGALAAGADPIMYRQYAIAYGILFQINDDIADQGETEELSRLKEIYENETAIYRDKCAIGVW